MALDAAMLRCTAAELKEKLLGSRLDKLYMPSRNEIVLLLRTREESFKLLISARSGGARLHLTKEEFENPPVPPAFCMLLRKRLMSGKIIDIKAVPDERICLIEFEATNELGDRVKVTLSSELMGRYSNLVIVDAENKIVDAIKRIDPDQSDKRVVLPGAQFTMPPPQEGKLPFFATESKELVKAVTGEAKPLADALLSRIAGICPAVCREIANNVSLSDADRLDDAEVSLLVSELDRVKRAASGDGKRLCIAFDGSRPVEFSFIELSQYGEEALKYYDAVSELYDAYYSQKDREQRAKNRSHDLKKQTKTLLERAERRRAARIAELEDTGKAEEKKLFGELLTANLSIIPKGAKSVELLNYYTGENIKIPLDQKLSPSANAQKYYKEYRKLHTAKQLLTRFIEEGRSEIEYLTSVLYEIDEAASEQEFINIRKELKESGFLRSYKAPAKKPQKTADYLEFRTSDGLKVLSGRSNTANDKLTFKTADKRDIWFHVKDAAGSHTVLQSGGVKIPDRSLTEAAIIAAYRSSERDSDKVAVDYAEIRRVKKPPSARAGMVIYTEYKTAFVTPDKELVDRLRVK